MLKRSKARCMIALWDCRGHGRCLRDFIPSGFSSTRRWAAASCTCTPASCSAATRPLPISAPMKRPARSIDIEVKTVRHNPDPNYRAMAGTDDATLIAKGRADGELYRFKGALKELPGAVFQSVMTPVAGGGGADRRRRRRGRHRQRALFHPPAHARRRRGRTDRRDAAQQWPHPRRRCVVLLSRHLHLGERPLEGTDPQPGAHAVDGRQSRSSAATRSASAFPAPATSRARCWRPPHLPASAACG